MRTFLLQATSKLVWVIYSSYLINKPTYFKNSGNPTCIDLILKKRPTYFQLSSQDSPILISSQFLNSKWVFKKHKANIITYRDYKKYDNYAFSSEIQSLCLNKTDLAVSKDSFLYKFNKHAPIRKKIPSCKRSPFHD